MVLVGVSMTTSLLEAAAMGIRRKITSFPIEDEKQRRVTMSKRKQSLFKKAYELSLLCNCEVGIVVRCCDTGRWYEYATNDLDELLLRFTKEYSNIVGSAANPPKQP